MTALLWIVAAGLAFVALVFLLQDRMLYFPARADVKQVVSVGLRPWPSAQEFRGLVAEPRGEVRGPSCAAKCFMR